MTTWLAVTVTRWDLVYSIDRQRFQLLMYTINLEIEINQGLGRFSMSPIIFVSVFDGRRDKTENPLVAFNHFIENRVQSVIIISMLVNF